MELEELIENTLRRKHREQIMSFALFLFVENQKKSRLLDVMIARLVEIGIDLKESNRKIDSLTNALLKANSKVEKAAIEYKLRDKEYKKLEKKYNALLERLSIMNTQVYASSKSLKGIDRKRVVKGKHDDKDDFDCTPTAPSGEVPQPDSSASCGTKDTPNDSRSKE